MNLHIRHAQIGDLNAVTILEQRCFPQEEAADRDTFQRRLQDFPECFWVADSDGKIVSMVNGMTTDCRDLTDEMYANSALFDPSGTWLMLFGVATHPGFQGSGIASRLMAHVMEQMKMQGRSGIVLTCKDALIPFYERFGFVSEGVSASVHGGAVWHQMRLDFQEHLFECARTGEECVFYLSGKRLILYRWRQCDGDFLNVSDENGCILWQALNANGQAYLEFKDAFQRGMLL